MKKLLAGSLAALSILAAGNAMALTSGIGVGNPVLVNGAPVAFARAYIFANGPGTCLYNLHLTAATGLSSTDCTVAETKTLLHAACSNNPGSNGNVNFPTAVDSVPFGCEAYDEFGQIQFAALFLSETGLATPIKLTGFGFFDGVPIPISVSVL